MLRTGVIPPKPHGVIYDPWLSLWLDARLPLKEYRGNRPLRRDEIVLRPPESDIIPEWLQ